MADATNRLPKQRGRPFQKGQSGNPRGRKPGERSKITVLCEALVDEDAEAVVAAVIKAAKEGDPTAMRLVFERLMPARKGRPITIALPPIVSASDVVGAMGAVIEAVGNGTLSAEEAADIATLIETQRKAIETTSIEARLAALEASS